MAIEVYKDNKGRPAHLAVPVESHHYEAVKPEDQEWRALCGGDTDTLERGTEQNPYLLSFPCEECEEQLGYIRQSLQKPE